MQIKQLFGYHFGQSFDIHGLKTFPFKMTVVKSQLSLLTFEFEFFGNGRILNEKLLKYHNFISNTPKLKNIICIIMLQQDFVPMDVDHDVYLGHVVAPLFAIGVTVNETQAYNGKKRGPKVKTTLEERLKTKAETSKKRYEANKQKALLKELEELRALKTPKSVFDLPQLAYPPSAESVFLPDLFNITIGPWVECLRFMSEECLMEFGPDFMSEVRNREEVECKLKSNDLDKIVNL
jgi:hypothetical protein